MVSPWSYIFKPKYPHFRVQSIVFCLLKHWSISCSNAGRNQATLDIKSQSRAPLVCSAEMKTFSEPSSYIFNSFILKLLFKQFFGKYPEIIYWVSASVFYKILGIFHSLTPWDTLIKETVRKFNKEINRLRMKGSKLWQGARAPFKSCSSSSLLYRGAWVTLLFKASSVIVLRKNSSKRQNIIKSFHLNGDRGAPYPIVYRWSKLLQLIVTVAFPTIHHFILCADFWNSPKNLSWTE